MVRKMIVSVCFSIMMASIAFSDTVPEMSGGPSVWDDVIQIHEALLPDIGMPEKPPGMDPAVRRIYSTMIQPSSQPVLADNGAFVLSSVESYTVGDESLKAVSCSFIARRNLAQLLDVFGIYAPRIAQGDANDLIKFGRINNTLQSFSDKDTFLRSLDERRDNFFETVFDIYRHVPSRSHAFQGHRATVFLWEDNLWYILDPLDGDETRKPQLLSTYIENDVDNAEWLARFPGYSRFILESKHLNSILPFFSTEVQLFFQWDYILFHTTEKTSSLITDEAESSRFFETV